MLWKRRAPSSRDLCVDASVRGDKLILWTALSESDGTAGNRGGSSTNASGPSVIAATFAVVEDAKFVSLPHQSTASNGIV